MADNDKFVLNYTGNEVAEAIDNALHIDDKIMQHQHDQLKVFEVKQGTTSTGWLKFAEIKYEEAQTTSATLHIKQIHGNENNHRDAIISMCVYQSMTDVHFEQIAGRDITQLLGYIIENPSDEQSCKVSFYLRVTSAYSWCVTTDMISNINNITFFAGDTISSVISTKPENMVNATYLSHPLASKATADGDGNVIADTYATKDELDGKLDASLKGASGGLAELDSAGKVPTSQLPSYVDDVLEYSTKSSFPTIGETSKIYVDTNTNKTYRWSGSVYTEISASLALGETSSTAYYGDKGKLAYEHSQSTHAPTNAQVNVIEKVKVNGIEQAVTSKTVDISVPAKTSNLTNDSGFITSSSIPTALKNPNALTFGSKTYDGSEAQEITIADLGFDGSFTDYSLPVATGTQLGGIKSGGDISVDSDGVVTITKTAPTKVSDLTDDTDTKPITLAQHATNAVNATNAEKATKATYAVYADIATADTNNERIVDTYARKDTPIDKAKELATVFSFTSDTSSGWGKFAEIETRQGQVASATLHIKQNQNTPNYHKDFLVSMCAYYDESTLQSRVHFEQIAGRDMTQHVMYVVEDHKVSFYIRVQKGWQLHATTDMVENGDKITFLSGDDSSLVDSVEGGMYLQFATVPAAKKDANGNVIANTYATKSAIEDFVTEERVNELISAAELSGGDSDAYNTLMSVVEGKADLNHTHEISEITDFPVLATIATSGSYNDLSDRPTIPEAVIVDSELSNTSTNPVQNKVINSALAELADIYANKVSGEAGQFVVIGDDGNLTAITLPTAEGSAF